MPYPTMTGAEFAAARAQLGATQSDLALTLGISLNTLRRYELDTDVPRAIALAVSYLLAETATPPSVDAAQALTAYQAATSALTTLYRLAKQSGARPAAVTARPAQQRMTPSEIALRNVEASEIAKRIKSAKRRNAQREEQRSMVANIHGAIERMTAQDGYTSAALHRMLAENLQMTDSSHTFVLAYLEHVRTFGPVGRLDPVVTLPDEPMPIGDAHV